MLPVCLSPSQVELTGFRVLMNLKDTEKEARLEQKAAAALNNLAHHFPKPPFAASRQQRLSRAVVSQEPLCRAAEEGLRSSGSAVSSSSSFVSCTGWGREEDSTSRKGTGDSDSRKIDEEGGIFGFFKRDSELSSRLPRSLSTRRGGADSGWDVEAVGREQTERGVPASPGRGVERFKLSSYSQAPTFVKVRSCSMVGLMILVFIRTELKNLLAGKQSGRQRTLCIPRILVDVVSLRQLFFDYTSSRLRRFDMHRDCDFGQPSSVRSACVLCVRNTRLTLLRATCMCVTGFV